MESAAAGGEESDHHFEAGRVSRQAESPVYTSSHLMVAEVIDDKVMWAGKHDDPFDLKAIASFCMDFATRV